MRSGYWLITLATSIATLSGSACAVTHAKGPAIHCVVHGAEQLPAGIGGAEAICAAIERAASGADASVIVTIINTHAAVAKVIVGGRSLPEQRVDVSDRTLNEGSFEMLAKAVAQQLK